MRLVNIALRDVKPKHFVLHPRYLPPSRPSHVLRLQHAQAHLLEVEKGVRRYSSTSALNESENLADLFLPGLSDTLQVIPRESTPRERPGLPLVQQTKLFKKWRALLTDPSRLAVESDFDRRGPAKSWQSQLLVDKLENSNDLALWSCLLDYQKRVNGDNGVLNVWRALWGRKTLYDVESSLALVFWQTFLEAAVKSKDNKFLSSIWIYSEWMYDRRGVKWPNLYSTVLSHFLRTHQHHQVLQWQLRLTPNFYPGAEEFASIVMEFATDHELYRTPTLESLYIVNPDRQLYDILVPYLYDVGASDLAAKWRRVCIRHDDVPLAPVHVRPFLRYLQGYFPNIPLHPEESAAIGVPSFESPEDAKQVEISREFINRIHGGTFGISVKNYNDKLGAKWLASSWVSLDIAITTISALGIEQIGPLSLQSIALRERTPEGVLNRIQQLQEHGISVADSNYFKLVIYLARMKDQELLLDLLTSDLHPDVFDDLELQGRLITSTAKSEDWRAHRLMLTTRIAMMERSAREAANALARAYILRKDQQRLLKLLDEMKSMGVTIDSDQTNLIFDSLVNEAKSTFLPLSSLYFYLPICRRLVSMEIPVPIRCWRKLLFCLARQSRIDELEKLCIELVDLFTSSQSSRPGFVSIHPENLPESMTRPLSGVENLLGVYIPLDLPTRVPLHPLRQIFDDKLMSTIIRYLFYLPADKQGSSVPALRAGRLQPRDFGGGRAVRLMRVLRDRGVFIDKTHLTTWVTLRLITFYGPGYPTKRVHQNARANNNLLLAQMKSLLDEAWGEELLPPLDELAADIETRGQKKMLKDRMYLQRMGKTSPQPRVVL
ncbi:hypothetical protein M426DRAFT_320074 [Hypoxylon sp. CI-4A]|nr:hypothetical protein M426DRAFT_320074 [Hypoxylon sp. CI-4A]